MALHQFGRPVEATRTQPRRCEVARPARVEHPVNGALIAWRTGRGKGERERAKAEVEQPIAQARLVVVVALGLRLRDDRDLALVQAKARVDLAKLWLPRLRVGQENAARTTFDDCRRNGR